MNKLASAGLETCNPSPWDTHRLWSLWEFMRKLRADAFFKAFAQASTLQQMLALQGGQGVLLLKRDVTEKLEGLSSLMDELTALGLTGAVASLDRGVDFLKSAPTIIHNGLEHVRLVAADAARVQNALGQTISRVPDDLATQVLLAVDPRRVHLYLNEKSFGDLVFKNFGSAAQDITEAATCLALDRGTVCALHLFRALEVALAVLAKTVGITKQNDWGKYITGIDEELQKREKSAGARTADEQFYAEISIDFDHMRRAWRNPTMHPEKNYSVEEAEGIFNSVRSFMQHLAARLSE